MSIARVNGVNLYYEVAGKGNAMVFLHGMTGSKCGGYVLGEVPGIIPSWVIILRVSGKSQVSKNFPPTILRISTPLTKKCFPVAGPINGPL